MADNMSLFGLDPQAAAQALQQQQQLQAMQFASQMGPQGNPFYVPGIGASQGMAGTMLGQGIGQLFGVQPPEIEKAYKMQAIQEEVESKGIDFGEDPVGYAKLAASAMLKHGFRQEALQAMNWALTAGTELSQQYKNLKGDGGAKPSDREQATGRIVDWLMRKENGEPTLPSEDAQVMADIEMIEPLKFTEGGTQMMDVNALRPRIARAMSNRAGVQTDAAPPKAGPVGTELGGSQGTYSPEPYQTGGTIRVPDPQKKAKEMGEATDRILNDLRQKPVFPVMQAFEEVEKALAPFMARGGKIPGLGVIESMFTMGEDGGIVKGAGRTAYQALADMGNKEAQDAIGILNAVDQLMALDISKWAGASQTLMEAQRQFRSKLLTKGAGEKEVIDAFKNYKKVLESEMATYLGGVDPMIKDRLMQDPAYGQYFEKALKPLPFGATLYGTDRKTGEKIYITPDGKKWVR